MDTKIEKLSSGKVVGLTDWPDGSRDEIHRYGDEIAILYKIIKGIYISECYFQGGVITKRKYDSIRVEFPDMPESGRAPEIPSSIKVALADEHRRWKKGFSSHVSDIGVGNKLDDFCRRMLAKPETIDLPKWQAYKKRVLGELSQAKADSLIKKFHSFGVREVSLTDTEIPEGTQAPAIAGGMIIKLPIEKEARRDVFIVTDKVVREFGYDAPFDDCQSYIYLKFD